MYESNEVAMDRERHFFSTSSVVGQCNPSMEVRDYDYDKLKIVCFVGLLITIGQCCKISLNTIVGTKIRLHAILIRVATVETFFDNLIP